jgi:alkanesulfonate monooxygenase SsuD/methylene tetrahydromethanopterin reductase-like flavin-dependent oxidoreductase (luciferase family)
VGTPASEPAFGLFFDLRNPEPWSRPWPEFLARSLEIARRAESLGADTLWFTEHHLFADGHLSQPLTWLSAVAAVTTSVRLGTGILVAPLHDPRHVAEQAALVDALSGGRLELGLGPGYVEAEYAAFDRSLEGRFGATERAVRSIRDLLADRVGPRPVQDPVPLWLGFQGPKNARRAGRLGVGLLSLNRQCLQPYLDGLAEAGAGPAAARMGGTVDLVVAEDPEAAWQRIRPHYAHQLRTYAQAHDPAAQVPPAALEGRLGAGRPPVSVRLSVVSPDEAVELILKRVAGLPARQVYTWASIAAMPDDLVEEHLRLFLTDVAPRVRSRLAEATA